MSRFGLGLQRARKVKTRVHVGGHVEARASVPQKGIKQVWLAVLKDNLVVRCYVQIVPAVGFLQELEPVPKWHIVCPGHHHFHDVFEFVAGDWHDRFGH